MTKPSWPRRSVASILAAAVLLPVIGYLAGASSAVAIVRSERDAALLASPASAPPGSTNTVSVVEHRLAPIDDATMRRAIAARPLDQAIANVAMVRDFQAQASGRPVGKGVVKGRATPEYSVPALNNARIAAWMPVLAQLGWRDTPAQLNRLYVAAAAADIATILDVSEALLRRQQLLDRITPMLALVETDPKVSADLVGRLQTRPAWRGPYLESTDILKRRDQLIARYGILRDLMLRGDRLSKTEVTANVNALDRGKLPNLSFSLWKAANPDVVRPLNDPDFRHAAANSAVDATTVPFDWQLLTGEGFSTDAFIEDGRSALEIKWNGRGLPVFVRQRTSAQAGRYVLDIAMDRSDIVDLSAFQFRLMCDDTAIPLRRDGNTPLRLSTVRPVPCAYPVLEIVGDVQPSPMPRTLILHALHMRAAG